MKSTTFEDLTKPGVALTFIIFYTFTEYHGSDEPFLHCLGGSTLLYIMMVILYTLIEITYNHYNATANQKAIDRVRSEYAGFDFIDRIGNIEIKNFDSEFRAVCELHPHGYASGKTRYEAVHNLFEYLAENQAITRAREDFSEFEIVNQIGKIWISYNDSKFTAQSTLFQNGYPGGQTRYDAVRNLFEYATKRYPQKGQKDMVE